MIRILTISLGALSLVLGAPSIAFAGGGGEEKKVPAGPVELYNALNEAALEFHARFGEDDTCPRNLDVPILVLPVVEHERLSGYAFVVPRICLTRGNQYGYISKIHYITDAMTRAAHRVPLQLVGENEVDQSQTVQEIRTAISDYVNEDYIDRIDLIHRDLRLLQ